MAHAARGNGIWVGLSSNTQVLNNTIDDSRNHGISVGPSAEGAVLRNNIIWGSRLAPLHIERAGIGQEANLCESGCSKSAPPRFENPAIDDFRVRAGSGAINAGLNLYTSGVTTDFGGRARPRAGAFDLGAYEFGDAPGALVVK